jgi:leucyl/phenylalanyl-tRNA--protein transferase
VTVLHWLTKHDPADAFPPPHRALREPNGLLAAGGDLKPERVLAAYRRGIFPWYEDGQPILWWSPDPRAVLKLEDLRVSRSLRRTLAAGTWRVTADTAFAAVVAACAAPRRYGGGTWITADVAAAFAELHALGWAHSFETWQDGELVGGLYGIAIGRVFFGESMFARVSDASKVAFVRLVEHLRSRGFALVDCQVASAHLETLGASNLPRAEFLTALARLCEPAGTPQRWRLE